MIIGTAGHIDHGKTALVKALTGIDTDRLPEEKRRGITLELGFAHLTLDDGTVAGVVDVPGHERFVKAMAAGAGGVDLVVLVVASDEGVMPQTREHLDICRLLGVRGGVVALTKSDLLGELGPEWKGLVEADLAQLTRDTFLEGAKVVACSAQTGEGLKELKAALTLAAHELPQRPSEGPLFLPVDRVFTVKGFGTVVTGTVLSGAIALDDAVSLLPAIPGPLRVRGLQAYGKPVTRIAAGSRAAVNVAGVEAEAVSRGLSLTRHGELPQTHMLDVELTLLPAAERPLPRRSTLLLHLGTAQVPATVALLDVGELRPGESALAQLRLGEKVVALPNQRFILRGSKALPGRGATVAGGRVLTLTPARRRRGAAELLRPLLEGDAEARLSWLLRDAGYRGLSFAELYARSGLSQKALTRSLELLGARGTALLVDKGARQYLSSEVFAAIGLRAIAGLEAFHAREPMAEGLSREELKQRLGVESERVFGKVVEALAASGKLEVAGERLRLPGRARVLTATAAADRSKVAVALAEANLAPPTVSELAKLLSLPPARVVELLKVASHEGAVVKVTDELYFGKGALEGLRDKLVAYLKEHESITTQAFKELVGQSRKFVIPLSEYFDREKVTLRVGEKRLLRRG
ncbi:MAG: selenocysteine-specific translation elongation factor [Myxococcaceae bacterium]